MLIACFDGAGKDAHTHNLVAVVGLATQVCRWEVFAERWNLRLAQDQLEYFHAGSFAQFKRAFKSGWLGNEPRRQALLGDLMGIIEDCELRKFGSIICLDDFHELSEKHRNTTLDAYALCAMKAVEEFLTYTSTEDVGNDFECIFEKGDPEDKLRELFRYYSLAEPQFKWCRPVPDRKGGTPEPFVGLQAAGWIAYEYYLDADRLLYKTPSNRWGLTKFEAIPGNIIMLNRKDETPARILAKLMKAQWTH